MLVLTFTRYIRTFGKCIRTVSSQLYQVRGTVCSEITSQPKRNLCIERGEPVEIPYDNSNLKVSCEL